MHVVRLMLNETCATTVYFFTPARRDVFAVMRSLQILS